MRRTGSLGVALLILTLLTTAALAQGPRRPGDPPDRGQGRFNPLMQLLDTDQDGVLSPSEIASAGQKLNEFDASGDGQLSGEELMQALPFGRGRGPGGPDDRPAFGRGGPGRGGPGRGGPGGAVSEDDFDKPPLAKDDAEKRILDALETMREGPRFANVSPTDGRLLRMLAEAIGAKRVVEIGTSTGESAVWFALALRRTDGHLFTHELDEGRAEVARKNFRAAGVDQYITLILGDAHETVKQHTEPIDILFLDADKEGYIDYLQKLVPILRPGGLIIAHNMNTRQADPRYLKAITEDPRFETLILLREGTGVGVTLKKR
jgi:predicted O-methyltransferase YrrM